MRNANKNFYLPNCLILETPKKKTRQKSISPQKSPTIPKSLFDKINVSIIIPNPETNKIVKSAMISAGAKVVSGKPENADIIISETQILTPTEPKFTPTKRKQQQPIATVSAITPKSSKSPSSIYSGQLFLSPANNNENYYNRTPRNILLNQIPWIFEEDSTKSRNIKDPIKNNSIITSISPSVSGQINEPKTPNSNENLHQNVLIISDTNRRFRPIFTEIKQKIEFHLGKVPQAYHITPFDPIPPHADEYVERYKAKLKQNRVTINQQPANNGYCYMCQTSYENAEIHHLSHSHQRCVKHENWAEFDMLANEINSEFLG